MVESKTGTMESKISMEKNTTARHKKIHSLQVAQANAEIKTCKSVFFFSNPGKINKQKISFPSKK